MMLTLEAQRVMWARSTEGFTVWTNRALNSRMMEDSVLQLRCKLGGLAPAGMVCLTRTN